MWEPGQAQVQIDVACAWKSPAGEPAVVVHAKCQCGKTNKLALAITDLFQGFAMDRERKLAAQHQKNGGGPPPPGRIETP